MEAFLETVLELYGSSRKFFVLRSDIEENLVAIVRGLHARDKKRIMARLLSKSRSFYEQNDLDTGKQYCDAAVYFGNVFCNRLPQNLEQKVGQISAIDREMRTEMLVEEAIRLYQHSVDNSMESQEAREYDTKFQNMELRMKHEVWRRLKKRSSQYLDYGSIDNARLHKGAAAYIWQNYVVPYNRPVWQTQPTSSLDRNLVLVSSNSMS